MKIKALLLSLIIAITSCTASISFVAAAETSYEMASIDEYDSSKRFLNDLKIFSGEESADMNISRGQFLSYVVKAMKVETVYSTDNSFADVSASHRYAKEIYTAKSYGLISGYDGGSFRPDELIKYNDAVKILMISLGYKNLCELKGGYPVGYITTAKQIDLINGVYTSESEYLTFAELGILLKNFLMSSTYVVESTDGENSSYRANGSILSDKWKLEVLSGVAKSAGLASSQPEFTSDSPLIEIDGKSYKTELNNLEGILGFQVDAYYSTSTKKIEAVYVSTDNKYVDVLSDDVENYMDSYLHIISGDKTKKFAVEKGFYYVKNGRTAKKAEFMFENGSLKLIDNDGDGKIEFVLANKNDYMVVSYVNTNLGEVYDLSGNDFLSLENKADCHYEVFINNEKSSYANLEAGMVLRIQKSEDLGLIKIYAGSTSVKGSIDEIGEDYFVINGSVYKPNSYFKNNFKYSVGKTGEFLISDDGTLTAIKQSNSGKTKYGYYIAYHKSQGLSNEVFIKLLCDDGNVSAFKLADKISLNGNKYSADASDVTNVLINSGYPKYGIVKYSLNEDGLINKLVTATDIDLGKSAEDCYGNGVDKDNTLERYVYNQYAYMLRSYKTFLPYTTLASDTIIFSVPTDIADSLNTSGTDKRLADYNEKYFNVISASALPERGALLVDVYDQNAYLQAGAIVMYNGTTTAGVSVPNNNAPVVIHSITDALNGDGDVTKKITFIEEGQYKSYYLTQDMLEYVKGLSGSAAINVGDVVRVSRNAKGDLVGIVKDAGYNYSTNEIDIVVQGDSQVNYPYHSGKLFSHNDQAMSIIVDKGPAYDSAYSGDLSQGLASFSILNGAYYISVDTKSKNTTVVKNSDFRDALAVGTDNASKVLVRSYYHGVSIIVEYV